MTARLNSAGPQHQVCPDLRSVQQPGPGGPGRIPAFISHAFTLIEVVGVLAVLAILATLMAPAVIKQIDHAAWVKENNDLSSISNALVLSAMRTHILDTNTWAQAAANWLDKPVFQITSTPRNYQRVLLVDPNLNFLPYSQKSNGGLSNPPTNSRVMIVSSISGNPPVSANPSFQAIWDTPQGATPPGWPIRGEDLCIQRINLEPLFFQLLLVNRWGDTNAVPAFSTDADPNNSNLIQVPPGGQGINIYYLDSTVVNLFTITNSGPTTTTNLVTRFLLKRNTSYVFENGTWQGQIMNAPPVLPDPATQFAIQAEIFFNASTNLNNGASPKDVLSKMFTYMADVSMTNSVSLAVDANSLSSSAGANGLLKKKGGN